jgi:hypothetical protein
MFAARKLMNEGVKDLRSCREELQFMHCTQNRTWCCCKSSWTVEAMRKHTQNAPQLTRPNNKTHIFLFGGFFVIPRGRTENDTPSYIRTEGQRPILR